MKNLKYIFLLGSLILFNIKSFAQVPLQFGDAVVTHSVNGYTGAGVVVRTITTSNTVGAPLGSNWNTATMLPIGNKPPNLNAPNWTFANLGHVYGITLDQNAPPNIYISSTQVYGGGPNFDRKIWRLNGSSAAHTLVFDFNNPSGSGILKSSRSLGNVKYSKFGVTENMYVSDLHTGEIHRLTGNSSASALWANSSAFIPKFGAVAANLNNVPYGIAIRRVSGSSKLFYARLNTAAMSSTFQIWSIDLNAVGDFVTGTETQQLLPVILGNPNTPISDLAFTNDGSRMLIGQQSWNNVASSIGAHGSMIIEIQNTPINTTNWLTSGNSFPAGGYSANKNSVGGVSYSNNVLQSNNQYLCDASVYFTSDAINFPAPYVYGVEAYTAAGGAVANSIWIDQDDNILNHVDKHNLGDVEIYKKPQVCNPCNCGSWGSIGLNDNVNWWVNGAAPQPPVTTLSFNQGASTGVLFPKYNCNGDCDATYTYGLINSAGTNTVLLGSNSLNLSQNAIKNLPCGSYFITITPKCGDLQCPPIRIPLVIVCPPVCDDCKGNATVTANGNPTLNNGLINGNFTINNSLPVAEVRVVVEEFRVTSSNNNENCLLCKNPPKTWGSIQSATLGALSPAFSNAITIDNREAVFNNGGVIPMPGSLALSLALPATTGLECCNLKVEICLKIIIRDVNCCEKEILRCFSFDLK